MATLDIEAEMVPWLMSKPHQSDPGHTWSDTIARPGWQRFAACRGSLAAGTCDHFATSKKSVRKIARAKALCATCPVMGECRAFALGFEDDLVGVWGGLDDRERAIERARVSPRAA